MPPPPDFDAGFREQLAELLAWRRDVRRFRNDPLPEGALDRLISLANRAPSVGLSQPWRFAVVSDAGRRAAIRAVFERCNADALTAYSGERARRYATLKLAGLDEAPVHLAVFADRLTAQGQGLGRRTMPETIDYSAVMAVYTLWLVARAENIGVGWVSILEPARVTDILETPPGWRFIAYLCLGYPQADDSIPTLESEGWETRRPSGDFILRR